MALRVAAEVAAAATLNNPRPFMGGATTAGFCTELVTATGFCAVTVTGFCAATLAGFCAVTLDDDVAVLWKGVGGGVALDDVPASDDVFDVVVLEGNEVVGLRLRVDVVVLDPRVAGARDVEEEEVAILPPPKLAARPAKPMGLLVEDWLLLPWDDIVG